MSQGLTPYLGSADYREAQRELERLCHIFELNELLARPILELSGGERQRVLIVRALAQNTDVIILDEPLTSLDWPRQESLMREVSAVCKKRDALLILSIHEVNLATLYGDTVILMSEGRVIGCGAPSDLVSSSMLERAFGARANLISHPTHETSQVLPWGPSMRSARMMEQPSQDDDLVS
jgi:iron complex transport system ATP-binding protein